MINPERFESSTGEASEYNYDIAPDGLRIEITGSEDADELAEVASKVCRELGYHLLSEDELALTEGDVVDLGRHSIEIRDNKVKILLDEAEDDETIAEMERAVESVIG